MKMVNDTHTFLPETKFLSLIAKSREEFIKEFKKYNEDTAKNVYLQVLVEIENAISKNNFNYFKNLSNIIEHISSITKQELLKEYYENTDNLIKRTNVVILICQHQNDEMLDHLFNIENKLLSNLSVDVGITILPNSKDHENHNAFYYAISNGNINLLNTLITKWPGDYFISNTKILDEILSETYEELNLKNIPLSDKMKIFVEDKLINLRFFSNGSYRKTVNIEARIKLLLDNINLLNAEYYTKDVDNRFIFIAKFIAQNINILKRQLKSTYDTLPWEEIEFCLISFISSQIKEQEINIFYQATLNTSKILNYLNNFARKLEIINLQKLNIKALAKLPNLSRKKIVENIILSNPQFEELYSDFQKIMDVYSLQKISNYIKLALSTDPNEMQGHFIITRVLQVFGEYLKNTLESPKLSDATSEHLLLSLPKNTRKVIIDLRNSLSHGDSLLRRTEIEENTNVNYFIGIQNDIKNINDVINEILNNIKMNTSKELLRKIVNSKDLEELQEIKKIFHNVNIFSLILEKLQTDEQEKFDKLIKYSKKYIPGKTNPEIILLKMFEDIINKIKTKRQSIFSDYFMAICCLHSLCSILNETKMTNDIMKVIKYEANEMLKKFTLKIDSQLEKYFRNITMNIFQFLISRLKDDTNDEFNRICVEFFYLAEFKTNNKWIDGLKSELLKKNPDKSKKYVTEELLTQKLTELKSILNNNSLTSLNQIMDKYTWYKKNNGLQATIEMLILDIMSILDNHLENNLLSVEAPTPLLIGKCLRNHLAHYNTLVDLLLIDPSIAILLNAKKLTEENIIKNMKKIGQVTLDNPIQMKMKFEEGLAAITNQQKMIEALEEGNLETVKECIINGADINSKSFNSWTSLHFATKGPNLEVVKFVLNHNSKIEVVNGKKPLHIAAAYGRNHTVDYFIKKLGSDVNEKDEKGKTPLHFAAMNGHKDTVELLLKHEADFIIKDLKGNPAWHYAIKNNHIDVATILLEKDVNVDINETLGGYTPLHVAAERGYVQLVNFLLKNNANVNAKTDKEWIPLHPASLNGHVEVVNILIQNGADVNSSVINGCRALHYAVECGHENVVDILLKHKAAVNIFDKTYNNSPLHYASKDGHTGIVKKLLKHKANANIATYEGMTPLHFASENGHAEIVIALLQYDVDINAKEVMDCTPLHLAAKNGHTKVAEILIQNNANMNAFSINGSISSHLAAYGGHTDIIKLLIKYKGDITSPNFEGKTPLHDAASVGSKTVIDLLIKNKADVNAKCVNNRTPLCEAVSSGSIEAVQILIENNATADTEALYQAVEGGSEVIVNLLIENKARIKNSLLLVAVEGNHINIVEILIKYGVSVNAYENNISPLSCAVRCNHKEIVELLIKHGANVNTESNWPLQSAILAGYTDIVKILLNNIDVDSKFSNNNTALHLAAGKGHTIIVNELIKRGANVNALAKGNCTPLHLASDGHEDTVELLISNKAKVNAISVDGTTPLHIAAAEGFNAIIKILLENEANINVRDKKNRTPFELAVDNNHFQVVKTILQHNKLDLSSKDHDVGTVLHIATSKGNLEIVKYLVNMGFDINAKNINKSKPIHIAAREGYKDIVEYFLNKGLSIHDPGCAGQTLIHYAAINVNLELVNYLILLKADINAKDANGMTPIHIASQNGNKNIIEILLKHGAIYNPVSNIGLHPLEVSKDQDIFKLFSTIDKLFKSVKRNNLADLKDCIKSGVLINVRSAENGMPLHYAACKGYDDIVSVLLQNKCNPNVVGDKGYTPLHYASKFSHLNVVKMLLSNGAIYNAVSDTGKKPIDFAEDTNIINLFKLISESFKQVENNNSKIINNICKIKDMDVVKAVMSAQNTENQNLVVAAIHNNFTKLDQLKHILQGDVPSKINEALLFLEVGDLQKSLKMLTNLLERSKKVLGENSPGTLDILSNIAKVYYKQGNYNKTLKLLEEIYGKRKEMLGLHYKDTLSTRSFIGLLFHRLEKNEEAYNIFQEVYEKEKELLGPTHSNTITTQFHMALVLDRLGKYDEALKINERLYHYHKDKSGALNLDTIQAQNNIALVLGNQGKLDESLKIYSQVYEKKKLVLGPEHVDTLRTLHSIAVNLQKKENYHQSSDAFEELLTIQKKVLGPFHPETLNTQRSIGNVFFSQGKHIKALKAFKECLNKTIVVFGPNHPSVLYIQLLIKFIHLRLEIEGSNEAETLLHLQKEINIAANDGDFQTIECLVKSGADLNVQDTDGRTPLHFAVNNRHLKIIKILLKNNADPTKLTNKGNTILHTAVLKGYEEIVDILLKHVKENFNEKFYSFINAETITSGTTALHVASKNNIKIVKCLMGFGAIYNCTNSNNETPLELTSDQSIVRLLMLTNELFEDAQCGKIEIIAKLQKMKKDDFMAVTNTRNNQGDTLLQVAIFKKHKEIAQKLIRIMKKN